MAFSSRQIREVRGWKSRACAHCGCLYRVLLRETTDEADPQVADAVALLAMARSVQDAPCPACGRLQPDLLAQRRRRLHLAVMLIAVAAYGTLLALVEGQIVQIIAGQYLLVAVGLASLLLHACILWIDPNRDRERGIVKATRLLGEGSLQMLPCEPAAVPARSCGSGGKAGWLMLALMLLAVPLTALAETCRVARGWPVNEGWQPLVAGDGDSARVTFAQCITSVNGCWKATAKARIANAKELGLDTDSLEVETQRAPWDRTIQARSSQQNAHAALWVRVHLPRTLNSKGLRLQLQVALWVCYPEANGPNPQRFNDRFRAFNLQAELNCADPEAGRVYQSCWRAGSALGGVMLLLGGAFFLRCAQRLGRLARPGTVQVEPEMETAEPV